MTTLPQVTGIQLPRPGASSLGPVAGNTANAIHPQLTGSDIWRILRANLWLIVSAFVLSAIVGVVLNSYLAAYHPRYTATGYVQIQSNVQFNPTLAQPMQNYDPNYSLVTEQKSQSAMLHTESLFMQVLTSNPDIRQTQWFKDFQKPDGTIDVAGAKDDLMRNFIPTPIVDTKLISVSFTYRKPADCSAIVKAVVNQHIENERHRNVASSLNTQSQLNSYIFRYENRIKELKNDTSQEAARLQLDDTGRPGGVGQKQAELQQLVASRLKADSENNEAKTAYDSFRSQVEQGNTPSSVDQTVDANVEVIRLKQRLDDDDIQLRAFVLQGNKSRDYLRVQADHDVTQQHLDETKAVERANTTVAFNDSLSQRVSQTQHELDQINAQIDKIRGELSDMTNTLSDYLSKNDEVKGVTELLSRARNQKDVLANQATSSDANTVAWGVQPETPDNPSFPQLPVTLPLCVALGLATSLAISFLREMLDTSVRSPRDIARVGQMNLLGMIAHESDDPQAAGTPLSTVIYGAPTSMIAEQFRQVRTRLQHAASLDTTRSILVTSPSPGDGKSTVAANLAAGLALNGRRILLVDANFRRPELHKIFEVSNDQGFANVLNTVDNFESAVRKTKIPNLDVMPTGPKPSNATELLESQLLIDFIERALEEYDHVIFDSGPMLVVSETVALAPRVDGVVTVVRARTNSRGLLQRMRDGLRQLKAEHLGVVLNGVRATGGGYYGRNIKTYYEYQNTDAA